MFGLSSLFPRKQRPSPVIAQPAIQADPIVGLTVLLDYHTRRAAYYETYYRANVLDDQACTYWAQSKLTAERIADQLGVMTAPTQLTLF